MKMKRYLAPGMLVLLEWMGPVAARPQAEAQRAQKKSITKPASSRQEQKAPPATTQPDYVIGSDDVLDINVWKEPDFSRRVPVRPDGKISLPVLNDMQAAGLTPLQLAAVITEMLRKYVAQPQVTVVVEAINSKRVFILGEVTHAGPTPLLPNMTVLQALSVAGGFTQFANLKGIYVLRNENGKQNRYPFNYKEAIKGGVMKQNITLKPGDTIVVP